MRLRDFFLGGGVIATLVLAVGIPWALSGRHSAEPRNVPPSMPAIHVHVVAHQGAAVQLMAVPADGTVPSADPSALVAAEQHFSLDLLRELGSKQNLTVSPASLALALSMLEHGAGGTTLAEIAKTMHTSALDPDAQGSAWKALTDAWASAADGDGFQLESANSLWQQHGLQVEPAFLQALQRYYGSGVWQVDFGSAQAAEAINQWTSQHTHGRITKLFDQLDPSTKAVLANAIYFKAKWADPFSPEETADGQFAAPGGSVTAPFMSADLAAAAAVTSAYSAVELPYRGGRFAALAIMPKSGTLADFVANLSSAQLSSIAGGLHNQPVALRMPRFSTTSTLDLGATLAKLGMPAAFGPGADFSHMSAAGLEISQVVQRTYLKVAEKGTEAAAATGIVMSSGAAMARTAISLDHPFLFLIRDTKTGAILFASEIQNPSA